MTLAIKIGKEDSPVRGFIYFDAVTSFEENLQGSLSSFPLDNGVPVADHFSAKNPAYTIRGILSAVDISGSSGKVKVDGESPMNAKQMPATTNIVDFSLGVMQFLPGSVSQFFKTAVPSVSGGGSVAPTEDKVKEVLRNLMSGTFYNPATKRNQNQSVLCTLYEFDGTNIRFAHEDLVITQVSFSEDVDSGADSIFLSITLEKARFTSTQKVATPLAAQVKATSKKGVKAKGAEVCTDPFSTMKLSGQPTNLTNKITGEGRSFADIAGLR